MLDWHAAGTGSIPRCGKGFFSRVNFQRRLAYSIHTSWCAIACIKICVHVKDPVVHVRVWWIVEAVKYPACIVGWVVRLSQLAFPGESNVIFPWEKSHWDNTVVKSWFFLSIFFKNTSFQELLHSQPKPATALCTFSWSCIVHILFTNNSVIHFPPSYLWSVIVKHFEPPIRGKGA